MSLESINRLVELTGRTNRTIKKRLEGLKPIKEGRSLLYETTEALPLIYDFGKDADAQFDLTEERARLAHHQANKTELEEKVLRGQLLPYETVQNVQSRMIMAFRAKCLSLPTKTAPRLAYLTDLPEIEAEIRSAVYDALSELSEFRVEDYGIICTSEATADE